LINSTEAILDLAKELEKLEKEELEEFRKQLNQGNTKLAPALLCMDLACTMEKFYANIGRFNPNQIEIC